MTDIIKCSLPAGFTISREWHKSRPTYTLWLYGQRVAVGSHMHPLRWHAARISS